MPPAWTVPCADLRPLYTLEVKDSKPRLKTTYMVPGASNSTEQDENFEGWGGW